MDALTHNTKPATDEKALLADLLALGNLDDTIPKLARDRNALRRIESAVQGRATTFWMPFSFAGSLWSSPSDSAMESEEEICSWSPTSVRLLKIV